MELEAAGRRAKVLAVLSVAGFWVLPWSPLVAIAAVSATKRTAGWPARVATAGAWLTVVWTAALAALLVGLAASLRGS